MQNIFAMDQSLKGGLVKIWIQQFCREGLHRYKLSTPVSFTLKFMTEDQAMFLLYLHFKFHNKSQTLQ